MSSIFDRLTDSSRYTGAHKHRFDSNGRGRGLSGRESIAKGSGTTVVRGASGPVADLSQITRPNLNNSGSTMNRGTTTTTYTTYRAASPAHFGTSSAHFYAPVWETTVHRQPDISAHVADLSEITRTNLKKGGTILRTGSAQYTTPAQLYQATMPASGEVISDLSQITRPNLHRGETVLKTGGSTERYSTPSMSRPTSAFVNSGSTNVADLSQITRPNLDRGETAFNTGTTLERYATSSKQRPSSALGNSGFVVSDISQIMRPNLRNGETGLNTSGATTTRTTTTTTTYSATPTRVTYTSYQDFPEWDVQGDGRPSRTVRVTTRETVVGNEIYRQPSLRNGPGGEPKAYGANLMWRDVTGEEDAAAVAERPSPQQRPASAVRGVRASADGAGGAEARSTPRSRASSNARAHRASADGGGSRSSGAERPSSTSRTLRASGDGAGGRVGGGGGGSIFDRLTDASLYTGAHKHRFDSSGQGRGAVGRTQGAANVALNDHVRR